MTDFMHLVRPNVAAPAAGSSTGPSKVRIHASALLQMLEIVSKQVLSNNKRIIGSLLGIRSDDGNEFEIRDCFMVPCNETGDSIVIEDQIHKTLFQLYKRSHPKETVLGWFGSNNEIDYTTSLIHDFYSKGSDRAFPFPAIHLNVKFLTETSEVKVPEIETYIGGAVGKPSSTGQPIGWKTANVINSYIFTPIPNEVINGSITEKIAFKNLQQQQGLNNDLSYLTQQLNQVNDNISQLLAYIESNPQDIDLLRLLSNTVLNKPKLLNNVEELKELFCNHDQDVIMIEFLTKALKDQIELSARLTASAESDKKY
ncbi:uncharacterized protein J8A68_002113 [[Candida] subhashii]|uniref:MPN domain-containing protein n=1 Tax=[Candida] subhashii TaxID=561895 RepID=A0A8J5QSB6_9ASCO|nr:uncharacterized protein J8A68_002113 [[Candida] subhashii]KAG7664372.1 hypothetical protein J8A68_002113 [[Candida] subhashii]